MNVEIKKAKITNSLFLYYEFKRTDITSNDICKISSDAPIHDDLYTAFRTLIPFFALMTEQVTDERLVYEAIKKPENYLNDISTALDDTFFRFRVTEILIKLKDGSESYQLFGSRLLAIGKEIHFSTPEFSLNTEFSSNPEFSLNPDDDVKFKDELIWIIADLKREVVLYMEGKQAPKQQLELFGDEEESEFELEIKTDDADY